MMIELTQLRYYVELPTFPGIVRIGAFYDVPSLQAWLAGMPVEQVDVHLMIAPEQFDATHETRDPTGPIPIINMKP